MTKRSREFQDCRNCDDHVGHTAKAGCVLAVQAAQAANERTEVKRSSVISSPRTGPGNIYTYRPKMGDVVIFPNGIEFNYSEHDQTVVVTAPKGCGVVYDHTDGLLTLRGIRS